jgi:hypothetical protein
MPDLFAQRCASGLARKHDLNALTLKSLLKQRNLRTLSGPFTALERNKKTAHGVSLGARAATRKPSTISKQNSVVGSALG